MFLFLPIHSRSYQISYKRSSYFHIETLVLRKNIQQKTYPEGVIAQHLEVLKQQQSFHSWPLLVHKLHSLCISDQPWQRVFKEMCKHSMGLQHSMGLCLQWKSRRVLLFMQIYISTVFQVGWVVYRYCHHWNSSLLSFPFFNFLLQELFAALHYSAGKMDKTFVFTAGITCKFCATLETPQSFVSTSKKYFTVWELAKICIIRKDGCLN